MTPPKAVTEEFASQFAQEQCVAPPVARRRLIARRHLRWLRIAILWAGDLLSLAGGYWLASTLTTGALGGTWSYLPSVRHPVFALPFFALTVLCFGDNRERDFLRPEKDLALTCKTVSLFFSMMVCAQILFLASGESFRYLFLRLLPWYGVTILLSLVFRFIARVTHHALWRRGLGRQRVLLTGSLDEMNFWQQQLTMQRFPGYQIVGALHESQEPVSMRPAVAGGSWLGSFDDWKEVCEEHAIDVMLMSDPGSGKRGAPEWIETARNCQQLGIAVEFYLDCFSATEFSLGKSDYSGAVRLISRPPWSWMLHRVLKGSLDLAVGIIGSVFLFLITPAIALLIKLEDGGPIFYRSAYLGQDLRDHHYLKFRTMRVDADAVLASDPDLRRQFDGKFKLEVDPRVTKIGRFLRKSSLDEFPQFLSVLVGQLSYVGPRTIRREEAVRYGDLLPKLLSFRPGVTGFWQVMGRQSTTYDERVRLDMFYIDHWSIWMDMVIVAKTFWQVLRADGAY